MARGRPPGQGKVAGSGRQKGSLDAGQRKLITSQMAGDLMEVYERLGGVDWLLSFAKKNPSEFIRSGLSRLWPAPAKDDEPGTVNNLQVNIAGMTDREIACRVAYALNAGLHPNPALAVVHDDTPLAGGEPVMTPQEACRPDIVPDDRLKPDPERERWASELPLTPEERRNLDLARNTREANISNYAGSAGEQGGGTPGIKPDRDPRSAQRDRMLSRRNELL